MGTDLKNVNPQKAQAIINALKDGRINSQEAKNLGLTEEEAKTLNEAFSNEKKVQIGDFVLVNNGRGKNKNGQTVQYTETQKAPKEQPGFMQKVWNKITNDVQKYKDNYANAWNNSEGFVETAGALIGATTTNVTELVKDNAHNIKRGVEEVTGSETAGNIAKYLIGMGFLADVAEGVEAIGDWTSDKVRNYAESYTGKEKEVLMSFADFLDDVNAADIALLFAGGTAAVKGFKALPQVLELLTTASAGTAATVAKVGLGTAGVATLTGCKDFLKPDSVDFGDTIVQINIDLQALIEMFGKNHKELIKKLDELEAKYEKSMSDFAEILRKMLEQITQQNSYLSKISEELAEQGENQRKIIEKLDAISSTLSTIESFVVSINENVIINGENMGAKMQEIINTIKNSTNMTLAQLNNYMKQLTKMFTDVLKNQQTQITLEQGSKYTQEQILSILETMAANGKIDFEKLLELLGSIKSICLDMTSLLKEHFKNDARINELLTQILNATQDNGAKQDATNNMLSQLMAFINRYESKFDTEIKAILEAIANNTDKVEETNKALEAMNALLAQFPNIADAAVQKILAAIGKNTDKLGAIEKAISALTRLVGKIGGDANKNAEAILNAIANNTNKLDQISLAIESLSAIVAQVGDDANANAQLILEAIAKNGGKLDAISKSLNALNKLMVQLGKNGNAAVKAILKAISENTAKLDAIQVVLEDLSVIVNNIGTSANESADAILQAIAENTAKLEDIKGLLEAIKTQDKVLQKEILDCIAKLGFDMSKGMTAIVIAINSLGKNIGAKLEKLFKDALEHTDKTSEENTKAIIDAISKIKVSGDKVDIKSLEGMLRELIELTRGNNNLLTSIDAKLDVLKLTAQAIEDKLTTEFDKNDNRYTSIMNILGALERKVNSYDDTALLEKLDKLSGKLDDILKAIKDHKITVDVTGTVTCNCNCGNNGNHEGIIGDLEDILG